MCIKCQELRLRATGFELVPQHAAASLKMKFSFSFEGVCVTVFAGGGVGRALPSDMIWYHSDGGFI